MRNSAFIKNIMFMILICVCFPSVLLAQDKQDGLVMDYYDTGEIRSVKQYKDGVPDGPWREYYKNGQILKKAEFDNSAF